MRPPSDCAPCGWQGVLPLVLQQHHAACWAHLQEPWPEQVLAVQPWVTEAAALHSCHAPLQLMLLGWAAAAAVPPAGASPCPWLAPGLQLLPVPLVLQWTCRL